MDECKPLLPGCAAVWGDGHARAGGGIRHHHGRAVQVDPIKPTSKPVGTTRKRLKLKCDVLLSTSAFKFNLRRYTMAGTVAFAAVQLKDEVGRCRLTL